jgi:flagellar biosynthesis protein FliQ
MDQTELSSHELLTIAKRGLSVFLAVDKNMIINGLGVGVCVGIFAKLAVVAEAAGEGPFLTTN